MKLNRTTPHAVGILRLVSRKPDGITLDEVCTKLDMPKTSACDIMTILVQTGMVHVTREQKQRYTISLTAYRIGINYTNNLDFISTIDPMLKTFSGKIGKAVFFGIRLDDPIVYICKFEPENPIIVTATVGTKNPIYCTSSGKAIMVYMEDEGRDGVLSRISLKKHADRIICIRERFERELESVREKGYAFDTRELEGHMECMGTPVPEQDGSVMGTTNVSSLYKPTKDCDTLGRLVSDKGAQLSRLLEYIKHV